MADLLIPVLRQILRITTTDQRIFLGTFAGTDQLLNIVLVNAEEFRVVEQSSYDRTFPFEESDVRLAHANDVRLEGRYVGQILVPCKMIVKVEAAIPPGDEKGDEEYT